MTTETIIIQEYSFDNYTKKLQEAVQQGYAVDFESNEQYPRMIGTIFVVGLQKQAEEPAKRKPKADKA